MKQRLIASVAVAAVMAVGLAATASAQTVLKFNNWLPPGHSQLVGVIQPWMADVEKATNGRVKVELTDSSLGAPPRQYDIAADGIVDAVLGIAGYTPGRFKLQEICDLPLLSDLGEARAVALWRTFKAHFEAANEFKDVHMIGMYCSAPGSIQTRDKVVATIADYKGLKLRTGGGMMEDINVALGGVNVSAPAGQIYEIVSTGVADGALMGGEGYDSFKLKGLIKNVTIVPGGMYSASWYIVMNKAAFAKLSKEDQDAVMSVSGEKIAHLGGGVFDQAEAAGRQHFKDDGVNVTIADDAFMAEFKKLTDFTRDHWIANAKGLGVDGEAAMTMFENEARSFKPMN